MQFHLAISLDEHDLDRHGYMIGLTGTGKATTVLTIANGLIAENRGGAVVIDSHGDMSHDLLDLSPPSAVDRVILFDPVEQVERSSGLNLVDIPDLFSCNTSCTISALNFALYRFLMAQIVP